MKVWSSLSFSSFPSISLRESMEKQISWRRHEVLLKLVPTIRCSYFSTCPVRIRHEAGPHSKASHHLDPLFIVLWKICDSPRAVKLEHGPWVPPRQQLSLFLWPKTIFSRMRFVKEGTDTMHASPPILRRSACWLLPSFRAGEITMYSKLGSGGIWYGKCWYGPGNLLECRRPW